MKVLAIGNSFSEDAMRYLHKIASCNKLDLTTTNIYIGGCSLANHYKHMNNDERRYEIQFNGTKTGFFTTIKEALQSREWDIVTIQQASHLSFNYESYQPYAERLVDYIKYHCPKAKVYIHETWAYESDTERIRSMGYNTYDEMFADIKKSYRKLYKDVNAQGYIPSGTTMRNMLKLGLKKVHRDGFHADSGYGRFAISLTWLGRIFNVDVREIKYKDFDVSVSSKEIEIAKEAAYKALKEEK